MSRTHKSGTISKAEKPPSCCCCLIPFVLQWLFTLGKEVFNNRYGGGDRVKDSKVVSTHPFNEVVHTWGFG